MDNNTPKRDELLSVGMAHLGLKKVTREIPDDEPPALPPNAGLNFIGRSSPRWDAVDKVTGAACYTVDVQLPGMLFAAVMRSPLPHARIRSLDLVAARNFPGVRAAVTLIEALSDGSAPAVLYVGQPIAAIAAETLDAAEAAIQLIGIEFDPLPFAVDLDSAMKPDASVVYQKNEVAHIPFIGFPFVGELPLEGNVRGPNKMVQGNINDGFSSADFIVEETFSTQVQTHCCMEPHAIVADWHEDRLDVWMSTQFTAGVRAQLAATFRLPLSRVRVRAQAIGGGFGSKSQLGQYGKTAVMLSRMAKAPVRLVYRRDEEQMDSGNRPSSRQHLRIGASRDGKLTAISLHAWGSAGVAQGAGVGNIAMALYVCPNLESLQYDVFTNTSPSTAMRGPGNTQGAFALEQSIDALAEKLSFDPVALRDVIDLSPVRREERRLGALKMGWAQRKSPGFDSGPVKRGLGMAQSLWPTNIQLNAACEVRLWRDGKVEVLSSVQDIGTGVGTLLKQVVAEELGLRPEAIEIRIGDTEFPSGPPSYGSRTSASITPPARSAAWQIKNALLQSVASHWRLDPQQLTIQDSWIQSADNPSQRMSWQEAASTLRTDRISVVTGRSDDYAGFRSSHGDAAIALNDLGGVQFVSVAVDTQTGVIHVERVVAVHDCGRPINPLQIESQIHGGILMGISYALLEERIIDPHTGWMLNPNFIDYKFAGPSGLPQIDVMVLENYQGFSATDAYGVAEPANIATAAAIANAVYNAIGIRINTLPMTPARILQALHGADRRTC
ncbi:MAG: xanthine dehydrogenase family protein molybdopterin-binding subunit [Betaproteobacteria bacterium]|nr:xanthine dehydrogenase family protein molybdopterin-binding subunit [Betaproteobacteria bacterium]